jgi:hypothetical protein
MDGLRMLWQRVSYQALRCFDRLLISRDAWRLYYPGDE